VDVFVLNQPPKKSSPDPEFAVFQEKLTVIQKKWTKYLERAIKGRTFASLKPPYNEQVSCNVDG
jgi:hypothetical protein